MRLSTSSRLIRATEARVAQSGQAASDHLHRAGLAWRAAIGKPAVLVMAAGTAGSLGFWLARRRRKLYPNKTGSPEIRQEISAVASSTGLIAALILRYAMRSLPFVIHQFRVARRAEQDKSELRSPS
jgi:hypothetical protein